MSSWEVRSRIHYFCHILILRLYPSIKNVARAMLSSAEGSVLLTDTNIDVSSIDAHLTIHALPLGEPLGRIKMELFADVTPKTAENFRVVRHSSLSHH